MKETRYRSLLKGISWRIVAAVDTMIISWWKTGDPFVSLKIVFTEILTKIVLYYVHERIYFMTFGAKVAQHKISLVKGVTWRIIGSLDTVLITWFITNNLKMGLEIGSIEFITKIIIYYFHERAWNRIKLGIIVE